jgi:hypothetical protein
MADRYYVLAANGLGGDMTRQEEWEEQEAKLKIWFPSESEAAPEPTGVHKLNTRNRDDFNGYTQEAMAKLSQKCKKKKSYIPSTAEKQALLVYWDWRLANAQESVTRGTRPELKYATEKGVPLEQVEAEFTLDEKKRFNRSHYPCVRPPRPDVLVSDPSEETVATFAAWTVPAPINVVTLDETPEPILFRFLRFVTRKRKTKKEQYDNRSGEQDGTGHDESC